MRALKHRLMKNFVWLFAITCFFVFLFNVSAASKPEFTIKIGKLKLDGVEDVDIEKKSTVFELTERINHAGGPLDNDSKYTVSKGNVLLTSFYGGHTLGK